MKFPRASRIFLVGFLAGLIALGFNFLLRLGGAVAFPPESALSAFLRVIPASIEEPMVQQFGDLAGQLGLLAATLIGAVVYGILAVVFDRGLSRRFFSRGLGKLEGLLTIGLIPWLAFGLALFPIDGDAIFGTSSPYAIASMTWAFPFALLLVQGVFALVASLTYPFTGTPLHPGTIPSRLQNIKKREFIEKGTVGVLAMIAGAMSLPSLGQLFPAPPTLGGGTPIDLQDAPAIFRDPRLAGLVGSEVTANSDFYRVAIDIIDPTVDASAWALMVDGLVNAPKSFSLQDVRSFPEVEQYTTFECVSNNVNGNLIGNAKWAGVKVSDILANAGGVQQGANYVVFYSVDGYSVGIPLEKAKMSDSLLVYSMNGEDLPVKHGYPLRGVIPGLYGMMSAKWVKRISVVGSVYNGYWQTRGWTNDATIYTETFIVLPQASSLSISQSGGSVVIAGYAFAGDRGISKVEVSVDNGASWQSAQIKKPLSALSWTLWAYEWKPNVAGEYQVLARATDGQGQVQTATVKDTFPNGATGYANARFVVTD